METWEKMFVHAVLMFLLQGLKMLLIALPHVHEVGGLAEGDGEAGDVGEVAVEVAELGGGEVEVVRRCGGWAVCWVSCVLIRGKGRGWLTLYVDDP